MPKDNQLDPFQLLIIERLDSQNDSIRELREDIRDTKDQVVEIKTNHLAHVAADMATLKQQASDLSTWSSAHDQRHFSLEQEREKGRWRLWVALSGGILGLAAAVATAYIK